MHDSLDRIPLFPLSDAVHFPRTELHLEISGPRHLRLVDDLLACDEEERRLGAVLLRPEPDADGRRAVFRQGTMARVTEVERLPEGTATLSLVGETRFLIEREIPGGPYPEAVVRRVAEPVLDEGDAGVVAVRRELLRLAARLARESGDAFPLDLDELADLGALCAFEELVNRIATELDLPPLRKLALLVESLPDRALGLIAILGSRQQVIDLLRPYRHLAERSELN